MPWCLEKYPIGHRIPDLSFKLGVLDLKPVFVINKMNAYLFLGVLYFLLKKILFSLQERANEKRTRRPKLLNHVSTRDIKVVSYNMLALPLARDPPIADRLDHIERELMHQEPDSAY